MSETVASGSGERVDVLVGRRGRAALLQAELQVVGAKPRFAVLLADHVLGHELGRHALRVRHVALAPLFEIELGAHVFWDFTSRLHHPGPARRVPIAWR